MSQCEHIVIRHINNPEINRLTAPENRLFRPSVSVRKLVHTTVVFLCGAFGMSVAGVLAYSTVEGAAFSRSQVLFGAIATFPFVCILGFLTFLRQILIQGVLLYQRFASSSVRLRCCLEPSCSQYTIMALRKYGPVVGCIKSISRIRRCCRPGGIDYP